MSKSKLNLSKKPTFSTTNARLIQTQRPRQPIESTSYSDQEPSDASSSESSDQKNSTFRRLTSTSLKNVSQPLNACGPRSDQPLHSSSSSPSQSPPSSESSSDQPSSENCQNNSNEVEEEEHTNGTHESKDPKHDDPEHLGENSGESGMQSNDSSDVEDKDADSLEVSELHEKLDALDLDLCANLEICNLADVYKSSPADGKTDRSRAAVLLRLLANYNPEKMDKKKILAVAIFCQCPCEQVEESTKKQSGKRRTSKKTEIADCKQNRFVCSKRTEFSQFSSQFKKKKTKLDNPLERSHTLLNIFPANAKIRHLNPKSMTIVEKKMEVYESRLLKDNLPHRFCNKAGLSLVKIEDADLNLRNDREESFEHYLLVPSHLEGWLRALPPKPCKKPAKGAQSTKKIPASKAHALGSLNGSMFEPNKGECRPRLYSAKYGDETLHHSACLGRLKLPSVWDEFPDFSESTEIGLYPNEIEEQNRGSRFSIVSRDAWVLLGRGVATSPKSLPVEELEPHQKTPKKREEPKENSKPLSSAPSSKKSSTSQRDSRASSKNATDDPETAPEKSREAQKSPKNSSVSPKEPIVLPLHFSTGNLPKRLQPINLKRKRSPDPQGLPPDPVVLPPPSTQATEDVVSQPAKKPRTKGSGVALPNGDASSLPGSKGWEIDPREILEMQERFFKMQTEQSRIFHEEIQKAHACEMDLLRSQFEKEKEERKREFQAYELERKEYTTYFLKFLEVDMKFLRDISGKFPVTALSSVLSSEFPAPHSSSFQPANQPQRTSQNDSIVALQSTSDSGSRPSLSKAFDATSFFLNRNSNNIDSMQIESTPKLNPDLLSTSGNVNNAANCSSADAKKVEAKGEIEDQESADQLVDMLNQLFEKENGK